ncbi:MAG: hypothetical protein KC549_19040 [Myxococcales bacterium]|nr:hypothetical protein [Myxococcales bacterium]
MAWSAKQVSELLHSTEMSTCPKYFRKYAASLAEVIGLFELAGSVSDDDVMLAICNSDVGDDPEKLCRQFCAELTDETGITTPSKALAVVFQAVAVVEPPPKAPTFLTMPQHLVDPLKRVNTMRTEMRRRRGLRLANAAMSKLGQWRWVQRAPDEILPFYVDNSSSVTGYTQLRGYDQWVKLGGNPPSGTMALNCREAVLVVAREAGLLTHGHLRAAYLDAETAARRLLGPALTVMHRTPQTTWSQTTAQTGTAAYLAYLGRLDERLTEYHRSEPVSLRWGLRPRAGDLVFIKGNPPGHVCISLGRTWANGHPTDWVASLWHHQGGQFCREPLLNMDYESNLTFVPCPF